MLLNKSKMNWDIITNLYMQVIPGYVTKFVESKYDEVLMTSTYSKLWKNRTTGILLMLKIEYWSKAHNLGNLSGYLSSFIRKKSIFHDDNVSADVTVRHQRCQIQF